MSNSVSERVKKFRERLKTDTKQHEAQKLRDRERKQRERSKKFDKSPAEVSHLKKLNRDRVRKFRLKTKEDGLKKKREKNAAKSKKQVPVYKTNQALGKAVGKVKTALPKSPRKRKAVVAKLASSVGMKMAKIDDSEQCSISSETLKLVQDFYNTDSISRQAPGKRDFVTVRKDGKKEHVQKRHLTWSLRETYAFFQEKYTGVKIGLSKFCAIRPENVMLSADIPLQVCLCQYHENIRMLCESLCKDIPSFPKYTGQFVNNFVCSPESEKCMLGSCDSCPPWLNTVSEEDLNQSTTWYQWERITQQSKGNKKSTKKMMKVCKEGTVEDAITSLRKKLPYFLRHVYVKRQQAKYFEEKIATLHSNEAVVQVDFAENYTCQHQDEIQTAHWNQEQVTIFTIAVWMVNEDIKSCASHVIVSDDRKHDKTAVAVFINRVIKTIILEKHPHISSVQVFSDGPSSQFKNRFMVNFFHKLREAVKITWHFFATSHGKGVVDGIGGTVKRTVWKAVAARKVPAVTDASTFADVASKLCTKIEVTLISSDELRNSSKELCLDECFTNAPKINAISKYHSFEPVLNGQMRCRIHSLQSRWDEKGSTRNSSDEDSSEDEPSKGGDIDTDSSEDDDNKDPDDISSPTDSDVIEDEASLSTNIKVNVTYGLPECILPIFSLTKKPFILPHYLNTHVKAIVSGDVPFQGSNLITKEDLKPLYGNSSVERENWISNFVIDDYLNLMKRAYSSESFEAETRSWEVFENGIGLVKTSELLKGKDVVSDKDLIFIPCNPTQSMHWFGLAVLPNRKQVLALDSKAGDFIKPTIHHALNKCANFLSNDPNINLSEWEFFSNKPENIPQQHNSSDCGIYTCMYGTSLMRNIPSTVHSSSISEFRKSMILELHK